MPACEPRPQGDQGQPRRRLRRSAPRRSAGRSGARSESSPRSRADRRGESAPVAYLQEVGTARGRVRRHDRARVPEPLRDAPHQHAPPISPRSCGRSTSPNPDDVRHLSRPSGGEGSARALRACADVLVHVHLSENDRSTPGTGQIGWDETFAGISRDRLRRLGRDRGVRRRAARAGRRDEDLAAHVRERGAARARRSGVRPGQAGVDRGDRANDASPALGGTFITDGGIETTLIFHAGIDLPHFAAFVLLADELGVEALRDYFAPYIEIARGHGVGLILDTPTWRANPDWGDLLGYPRRRSPT